MLGNFQPTNYCLLHCLNTRYIVALAESIINAPIRKGGPLLLPFACSIKFFYLAKKYRKFALFA